MNDSSTQKSYLCDSVIHIMYNPSYITLKHQLYTSAIFPFLMLHSAYLCNSTFKYRASTLLNIFTCLNYNIYNTPIFSLFQSIYNILLAFI